ncbi:MAG: DUF6273 domain-containing protein [Lachnospiraceae bacterium]|nr:DUF6273 domain-containing protein [Lachnospiraceae bacterium]
MKMKRLQKVFAAMLVLALVMGAFTSIPTEAKEVSIAVPTIKVKTVSDGTGVKVIIGKTKDAEGFEIYVSGVSDIYADAQNVSDDYRKVLTVEKDGKKKRTVTIKFLSAGKVKIKVRSYNNKKFGSTVYSDYSKEKSVTLKEAANGYKTKYDFSKVKKGDVIKFGAYEQDNNFTNGKEAIEWIVLERTKKAVLVVSKYALDYLPYNKTSTIVTWETCTLRTWLNEKFYESAFNKTEKGLIKTVTLENYDNPQYGTSGGEDTKDKVFLLSQLNMIDTDYGFSDSYGTCDENRRCAATGYAIARGVSTFSSYKTKDGENSCYWWLRSPGYYANFAASVHFDGDVNYFGTNVRDYADGFFVGNAVRPALYINLNP